MLKKKKEYLKKENIHDIFDTFYKGINKKVH